MAMVAQQTSDFYGAIGTPSHDTKYDKLVFGFKSCGMKIIVTAGTLEASLNGSDTGPHMILGVGQYDFNGIAANWLFVRKTGATAQILAWAGK